MVRRMTPRVASHRPTRHRIAMRLSLALCVLLARVLSAQQQVDILIRGGTLVDGTGAAERRADVGIKGDRIILKDVATNIWSVNIMGAATGTEASPFSAAVS